MTKKLTTDDKACAIDKLRPQGSKLYQRRAAQAFPILVRQANARAWLTYTALAKEMGISNPRTLNYVLGSVGNTLKNLEKEWKQTIPPLQSIVVKKNTEAPGSGFLEELADGVDTSTLSISEKRHRAAACHRKVYDYPHWAHVLTRLDLIPTPIDLRALNNEAAKLPTPTGFGGAESKAHRTLKQFVAKNPKLLGFGALACRVETEWPLPSGDRLDVSFRQKHLWIIAEVKPEASSEADILRGLYQCIKYRALAKAQQLAECQEPAAEAVLVLEGTLPPKLLPIRNTLGVCVIERVRSGSKERLELTK